MVILRHFCKERKTEASPPRSFYGNPHTRMTPEQTFPILSQKLVIPQYNLFAKQPSPPHDFYFRLFTYARGSWCNISKNMI